MPGKQLDAMIVLLGATGYVGQAFARALLQRGWSFAALTRKEVNYTRFEVLLEHLRSSRPSFLINAAGHTGRPNVDACETALAETLAGNTLLAQTVAHACFVAHIPFGHVSSGCIYSWAKIADAGRMRIEKDLMRLELQAARSIPGAIRGFTKADLPNFSFRSPPCSFYSGTKALAEEAIGQTGSCCYLWRLRLPFHSMRSITPGTF
jgi:dTDP-4-dehydrorhamnose reductase